MAKRITVKPGDNPITIAKQYRLTVPQLMAANPGMTRISQGQQINLPNRPFDGGGGGKPAADYNFLNSFLELTRGNLPDVQELLNGYVNVVSGGRAPYLFSPPKISNNSQPLDNTPQPSPLTDFVGFLKQSFSNAHYQPGLSTPERIPGAGRPIDSPQTTVFSSSMPRAEQRSSGLNIGQTNTTDIQNALEKGYLPPSMTLSAAQALGIDPTQHGYSFQNGTFVYTGQNTGAGGNSYGLAPGERMRTDWGATIIGGQDVAQTVGDTPAGTGQYAQINPGIRGNKWKVVTQRDQNGNWVRKTVADYGRRGRGGGGGPAESSTAVSSTPMQFGLVSFRASTG